MNKVDYVEPLKSAWEKTKDLLFNPFNFRSYLMIGFCAWLASLFEGRAYMLSVSVKDSFMTFASAVAAGGASAQCNPSLPAIRNGEESLGFLLGVLVIFIFAALIGIVLAFVLSWVEARFEFIFLDRALNGKSELGASWKRFAACGNSIFLWRIIVGLLYGILSLIIMAVSAALFVPWILKCVETKAFSMPGLSAVSGLVFFAVSFFIVVLAMALLSFFMKQFVIPIMYRDDLRAWAAFCVFIKIFRKSGLHFIIFAVIYGFCFFLVSLAVLLFSFVTFGLSSILLMIPYVWALVLLPVLVFFRLYSVEFLRQFLSERTERENLI